MVPGKSANILGILWHPLVPPGTGNRERILKLAHHAKHIAVSFLGPGPSPPKEMGVRYTVVPPSKALPSGLGFNPGIFGYVAPWSARRMSNIATSFCPDLIQAEGLWAVPPARAAASHLGVPLSIAVNNLEHRVLRQRGKNAAAAVVAALEKANYGRADLLMTASSVDAQRLEGLLGKHSVKIEVIPNGVDPPAVLPEPARLPHKNVLFLGKTDYPPNAEAIRILWSEWLPAAERKGLDVKPVIVGGPSKPRVERNGVFTGYVESIWPYLAGADVCVAPLKAGSGTRLKVLSYFASGKPVIASEIAVEGLGLIEGHHYLRADTGDEFADALQSLFENEELASAIAKQGKELSRLFSWNLIADKWEGALERLMTSWKPRE